MIPEQLAITLTEVAQEHFALILQTIRRRYEQGILVIKKAK